MWTAFTDLISATPWFMLGLSGFGVFYIATHGLPATMTAVKNLFSTAAADFSQIHSVLSADISWLEGAVTQLATHANVTLPPKAKAVAPAPVVPAK